MRCCEKSGAKVWKNVKMEKLYNEKVKNNGKKTREWRKKQVILAGSVGFSYFCMAFYRAPMCGAVNFFN